MFERQAILKQKRRSAPAAESATHTDSFQAAVSAPTDEAIFRAPMTAFDFGSLSILPPESRIGPEGGELDPATTNRIQTQRGGGTPLDPTTQRQIEGAFGHNFANVHIHADGEADTLNRSLDASAFTLGSDIFFGQGMYDPGSTHGQALLAHELTHVVQQGGKSASGPLRVGAFDDRGEQEAGAIAGSVATGAGPLAGGSPGTDSVVAMRSATSDGALIQRAPKTITFDTDEGDTIVGLTPGVTPALFIEQQMNSMVNSVSLCFTTYQRGLDAFQRSMQFASDQEAESHYLNSMLKGALKAGLDLVIEGLPEDLIPGAKVIKEIATAAVEEHERVEKAEGEIKIVEFLDAMGDKIDKLQKDMTTEEEKQLPQVQAEFAKLASEYMAESEPSGQKGTGGKGKRDGQQDWSQITAGPAGDLLVKMANSAKTMRAQVDLQTPDFFQELITERFAGIGGEGGESDEEGSLYLECRVYRDENDYSLTEIDSSWQLKTSAPKADHVASSLMRSLKGLGKTPAEAPIKKVVHTTVVVESGHWYSSNDWDDTSYIVRDINEQPEFEKADAEIHGNSPNEFLLAWEMVIKEKVKEITKISV
jgi:hypothetical protein